MSKSNIVVILVRPSEAGNVGATARVLKNFGFDQLRVVDPQLSFRELEDKWMAVGAYDLIEKCQEYGSLTEAIQDISYVIGTTSGRFRAVEPVTFENACSESVSLAVASRVAWVFGNERNGLTFEELERCHATTCIATDPQFSVLNVSQTVALTAYECSRWFGKATATDADIETESRPVGEEEDALFSRVDELIKRTRFTRDFNHAQIVRELRSAYQRMKPSRREYGLLNGLVHRLLERVTEK